MDLGIRGKLAVVTGSTKGIGFAIAVGLAKHGALVVVNGRSPAETDAAVGRVAAAAGVAASAVFAAPGDLAADAGFEAFVARVDAVGKPVDILVLNHGIFSFADFLGQPFDTAHWENYFRVNVFSQARLAQRYLKGMLERKWGRVLLSSSAVAVAPPPMAVPYATTKTAQLGLARALSELTKGTEVTVNSVLIGPTDSDGSDTTFRAMASAQGKTKDEVVGGLLGAYPDYKLAPRLETSEEIANVFLFLASKQGLVVNGASQRAEAGTYRSI